LDLRVCGVGGCVILEGRAARSLGARLNPFYEIFSRDQQQAVRRQAGWFAAGVVLPVSGAADPVSCDDGDGDAAVVPARATGAVRRAVRG